MKKAYVLLLCLLLGCLYTSPSFGQDGKKLTELKPITGEFDIGDDKFSMNDRAFQGGLYVDPRSGEKKKFAVYDLSEGFTRLSGVIGVPDAVRANDNFKSDSWSYIIKVDGREIKRGTKGVEDNYDEIDIDLSGVKTLRIELEGRLVFTGGTLEKASDLRPTLLLPLNLAKLTGNSQKLIWAPVEGAVSYSVELICSTSTSPLPPAQQRVWILNTKSAETEVGIDLRSMPSGQYKWQVIAFGKVRPLGKFSGARSFTISR